jgi:kynurenine formamidase
LHAACGPWLRQHDIAILGTDAAADVIPSRVEAEAMPIHQLTLVAMGVWILDACDLEAVAVQAQKSGRWEFLLTASPLAVPGATGSPINPAAVF